MIHFGCPNCQQRLKAPPDQAEKLFRCPRCSATISAPKSLGSLVVPDFAEECDGPPQRVFLPEPTDRSDYVPELSSDWEPEAQTNNRMLFVTAAGLTGCLASGIVVLVFMAIQGGDKKTPPVPVVKGTPPPVVPRWRPPVVTPPPVVTAPVPISPTVPEGGSSPQNPPIVEPPPPPVLPAEPVTVPGKRLSRTAPAGFEAWEIQRFPVMLSTLAIEEAAKDNGRPFKALEAEFYGLARVLPTNYLEPLRRSWIIVEWDNLDPARPQALGRFNPEPPPAAGRPNPRTPQPAAPNPLAALKVNTIEVLSLKRLAEEKEFAVERGRLVLLHAVAQAVYHRHSLYLDEPLKYAYDLAMSRRKYDSVETDRGGRRRADAAESVREYFAELSCAYLDRCSCFPFNREDLQKYDDIGYAAMVKAWEGSKEPNKKGKAKR